MNFQKKPFVRHSLCVTQSECITKVNFTKKSLLNEIWLSVQSIQNVWGMNKEWDGALSKFSKNISESLKIKNGKIVVVEQYFKGKNSENGKNSAIISEIFFCSKSSPFEKVPPAYIELFLILVHYV